MGTAGENSISLGWSVAINATTFALGFLTNRFLAKHTANRKEDRELVDEISRLIADIETKAYTYYSLPGNDTEAVKVSAEIRSLNSQIGRQVTIFYKLYDDAIVLGHVKRLKQAVTSKLDDLSRNALKNNDPVFEEIAKHCRILIGDLNMHFCRKYR
jgi:hypothetical protein